MNIVFIVEFMFPYGSANAMRARNIYRLLELMGHNVFVISDNEGNGTTEENAEFKYKNVFDNHTSLAKRLIAPYKLAAALKKYCNSHDVDVIIMNAEAMRFNKIATLCKKENMKLIIENCEWYDSSNFKLGKSDPRYRKYQIMMQKDFKKADGFISISRLLNNHNSNFAKSIRIPTILDTKNSDFSLLSDGAKLQIVYTGSPGRSKEYLKPVCEALANEESLRLNTIFNIYGPSYDEVINNIGDEKLLEECGESVKIHGRVPQNEIKDVLMHADFLIFLRPQRHSSHAGFPTKLGESFAVGTPVITNNTGDIGLYLRDGYNGYLLADMNSDTVCRALKRALNSKINNVNLRKNARLTAETYFDFRVYAKDLAGLLDGVYDND